MKPIRCFDAWILAAALAGALTLAPSRGAGQSAKVAAGAAAAPGTAAAAPATAAGAGTGTGAASLGASAPAGTSVGTPAGTAAAIAPPPEPGLYLGPTACGSSSCHGGVTPRKTLGIRQDEYFIWQKRDLHAQAYGVLFNDRSQTIARRMKLGKAPGDSQACLGCHALSVPARQRRGPLELEDGISCESCHGAASGWLEGHRSESWTHQQSIAAGMTDLRDIGTRARVCLDCHLGAPGQTVDHELLAAGHPPLGFELDNYSEAMPSHWLPFADRQPNTAGERDTHGTRAWAVGQAAAFRAELEQVARKARAANGANPASAAGGGRALWPEFTELRCDSCHHSLAQERWRNTAPPAGFASERPGLPRWSPSHYAVLRRLVAAVAPERQAALDAAVERLAGQLSRLDTPTAEVAATAEQLSREAAELIPRLDRAIWDGAQARRLLLAVARDEDGLEVADYLSAQQAALAVQTLVSQLVAGEPRRLRSGLAGAAEGLAAELQNSYAFDAGRFAERLGQLGSQLQQ